MNARIRLLSDQIDDAYVCFRRLKFNISIWSLSTRSCGMKYHPLGSVQSYRVTDDGLLAGQRAIQRASREQTKRKTQGHPLASARVISRALS